MYSLDEILRMSVEEQASDIHFTAGCPPYYRIDGVLTPLKGDKLQPTDLEALLLPILDNRHRNELETNGQTDLAYAIPGVGRFRVNVYKQRGTRLRPCVACHFPYRMQTVLEYRRKCRH